MSGNIRLSIVLNEKGYIFVYPFADRTGLEPATPCVTGMYSNQTELPVQKYKNIPSKGIAKIHVFCDFAKKNVKIEIA